METVPAFVFGSCSGTSHAPAKCREISTRCTLMVRIFSGLEDLDCSGMVLSDKDSDVFIKHRMNWHMSEIFHYRRRGERRDESPSRWHARLPER
ncbi:hypothetical protein OUZ56_012017 [Daphnia magna]|uniref:Uncharacterized protein n=1 Tax=Daphnia magna TaxID=35525 RepID=A0ABQ9Z1S9_9CRUS|nr:hypothetical protein OUZ56_012017 [Daphnia magna]